MPVRFELFEKDRFVECHWIGTLTQQDVFEAYAAFFRGRSWSPLWPESEPVWRELANLSLLEAPISEAGWAIEQASFFQREYERAGLNRARVATLAPTDLSYGMSRIYEQSTKGELPEKLRVFRTRTDALEWLLQSD
ncbi:MAG: hypothetical protein QNJ40_12320 [Xanthomonadales bacterium]|nr:hypothetical protein [Xanthomonadales bacterium]